MAKKRATEKTGEDDQQPPKPRERVAMPQLNPVPEKTDAAQGAYYFVLKGAPVGKAGEAAIDALHKKIEECEKKSPAQRLSITLDLGEIQSVDAAFLRSVMALQGDLRERSFPDPESDAPARPVSLSLEGVTPGTQIHDLAKATGLNRVLIRR